MNRPRLLLFFLFFIISFCLEAQINVPVNLNTGQPGISIPVYQITSGDLSLPVSLNYTAGVKAYQINGNDSYNIGVGWSLDAGGSISRVVKSLPDDYKGTGSDTRMGWIYGTGASSVNSFSPQSRTDCVGDIGNYYSLLGMTGSNQDLEPDVFNFNFGGISGQFVFDNNKVIQTLPYQDLNIQPAYSALGTIASFTVTTNNGNKYVFIPTNTTTVTAKPVGTPLYLRDYLTKYTLQISYTTVWSLSSIMSPAGGNISLSYIYNVPSSGIGISKDIFMASVSGRAYRKRLYTTSTYISQQLLSGISGATTTLGCNYASNLSAINNFQINENGTPVQYFGLNYASVAGRKYLQSVQSSNGCLKNAPYQFEYIGTNFNNYTSTLPVPIAPGTYCSVCIPQQQYQQDYWGYYNASGASTLVPNLHVYPDEPPQERYRLEQIPGYSGTYHYIGGGANRSPNTSVVTAGTLFRVTFPTGGSAKIDYESNQYFDNRANQTFNGGGVRVNKVTLHDGISAVNDIVKTYTYSGGVLVNRPQFAFSIPVYTDSLGTTHTIEQYSTEPLKTEYFMARSEYDLNAYTFDSPNIIYATGQEVQSGKGKTEYNYTTPATFGVLTSPEYASPNQWQATPGRYASYDNQATSTCASKGTLADGYNIYPFAPNPNYGFERGLLLNTKTYNEAGQLLKKTEYTYTPVFTGTAPQSVYGLSADYYIYGASDLNTKAFVYAKYKLYAGVNKYQSTVKETTYDPTDLTKFATSETDNFYNTTSNHTLLAYKSTSTSNDGVNFTTYKTRFKYPQDYVTSSGSGADQYTIALQTLKDNYMNNIIVENIGSIIAPGLSERISSASLTKFKLFTTPSGNKVFPAQALILTPNPPLALTSFSESSVNGSYQFTNDSKYRISNNYVDYNKLGSILSTDDGRQNLNGIHYDKSGQLPIAAIKNALASQAVYSSFDEETNATAQGASANSFDKILVNPPNDYSIVSGRVGNALSVVANFAFQKLGVTKGIGSNYAFSCWVKSTQAGTMAVTLTDASSHTVTQSISYTNTTGVWTYYRVKLPVGILNTVFNIKVQTNVPVSVDDMLFHPELSQVTLSSYNNGLKTAVTDLHANSTFYTYDALNRPALVLDQDKNILKRTAYNYRSSFSLSAYFAIQDQRYINKPVAFTTGPPDGCEPAGIIRDWNFGDGTVLTNGGLNPSHTYTSSGSFTITLTVHNPQYGTVTSQQQIFIFQPDMDFNLYACGIVVYEVCSKGALFYGTTDYGPCGSYPVGTNVFSTHINQDCNPGGSNFIWEMAYDNAPNTWILLSGSSTCTVNVPLDPDGSVSSNKSYTLRCTMAPHCSAQAAVRTYHINYFASGCSR